MMLTSFFFLLFCTLSISSQHVFTEIQYFKSSLRIPNHPEINPSTSQQNVKAVHTEDPTESLFYAQRMLQNEPVLISTQQTAINPPPLGPPPTGSPPSGPPPDGFPPPGPPPTGSPPLGPPPDGFPPSGPPPTGSPPLGPPPSTPIIVTTETYVLDVKNEEEIIIIVEDNQDALSILEALGTEQPQLVNGEDVFISSWWTIENEETAFVDWEQLESFIGAQYGSEPQIGIDVNAEDVPVELEIVVQESQKPPTSSIAPTQNINEDLSAGVINLTDIVKDDAAVDWGQYEQEEIGGVEVVYASLFSPGTPKCKQVQTCQKVFVRPIGFRNVCKNQLVCPKS